MATYGALPTTDESALERGTGDAPEEKTRVWRKKLGDSLDTDSFHWVILTLAVIDTSITLAQIVYIFLHECQSGNPPKQWILDALEYADAVSNVITIIFLLECVLTFVAYGPSYYMPGCPHWKGHIVDVTVITTEAVVDAVLSGKEREVAGLLVIGRLWRIVKIIEAAVSAVSDASVETEDALLAEIAKLQTINEKLERELRKTKAKLKLQGVLNDDKSSSSESEAEG